MKFGPKVVLTAIAVTAALGLAGCTGTSGAAPGGGETLTIGSTVDVQSFDPAQAELGHFLQYYQPVYDSLIRREPDGKLVPMLAKSWTYDASNTHLTLTLRQGVSFSDGTKVNATAVKTNLDRMRSENGPDANTVAQISDVTTEGDSRVVVTLKQPDPSLLTSLATEASFIASPKALRGDSIATVPVGSGPYELDKASTVAGSAYTFVKRKNYWDPSIQHYDKIVVKPITDNTAMLNALVSGQVNVAFLDPKYAAQAKKAGKVDHSNTSDWAGLLIYDRDGKIVPALKDPRVRQAINYALDRKALRDQVAKGFATVTDQVFSPATPAYDKTLEDAYPYDPAKAKSLMAEAGYAKGFTVAMPTIPGLVDPAQTAGISQYLGAIGITVDYQNIAAADFVPSILNGKYAMSTFSLYQGTPWQAANQMITPNADFNPLHATDPTVNDLLSKLQDGDQSEQDAAAKALNTYVTQQAWFAPFYRPQNIVYADSGISVQPQAQQSVPSIYNYAPQK